jgi:hypothetical protein
VVNVVTGYGENAGRITEHMGIDKVAVTGFERKRAERSNLKNVTEVESQGIVLVVLLVPCRRCRWALGANRLRESRAFVFL